MIITKGANHKNEICATSDETHVFTFESNENHLLNPMQFYKKLSTSLDDVVWKTEEDMIKKEAK